MRFRRGLIRQIGIAIFFVFAVGIPVYFISDAYIEREDLAQLVHLDRTATHTITPTDTPVFPPTWTPRPTSTPTATPTTTATPTEILIPNTGYDFSGAYIENVVHLPERGGQTMVTIVVPGVIDGEFFAEVEIEDDSWGYVCVILVESEDHLFCFGPRLPGADDARILVFEELGAEGGTTLVFEAEFEVHEFVPASTNTPTRHPATSTASFTITPTPTIPPWATPPTPDA
jgi:hypothetical protein